MIASRKEPTTLNCHNSATHRSFPHDQKLPIYSNSARISFKMTSNIVTTRVALGDLNLNSQPSPIGVNHGQPSSTTFEKSTGTTPSPLKSQTLFGAARTAHSNLENYKSTSILTENQFSGTKRSCEVSDECGKGSPRRQFKKRFGFRTYVQADKVMLAEDFSAGLAPGHPLQRDISGFYQRSVESSASGSTTPDSPASSFGGSCSSILNDSQNTVITEPDSPISRVITTGELRQVRILLRFASPLLTASRKPEK